MLQDVNFNVLIVFMCDKKNYLYSALNLRLRIKTVYLIQRIREGPDDVMPHETDGNMHNTPTKNCKYVIIQQHFSTVKVNYIKVISFYFELLKCSVLFPCHNYNYVQLISSIN